MKLPEPSHLLELWASGEFTEGWMLHGLLVLQMGAIVICPVYGMLGVVFHFGSRFSIGRLSDFHDHGIQQVWKCY